MEQGQTLGGRYRLEQPIGEGGMSVVWRAHDELLGRSVAVKLLASSSEAAGRSVRAEARAAARLRHPNVTNVYDYGESPEGHSPYIVMELLTGESLADVAEEGPLPPAEALRICAEVAAALAAAHSEDVVHRDVKPSNVMLTAGGAKVLDFGIAAAVGESETYDARGRIMGTPAYVAPERIAGAPAAPANDVYSLGLLLYRLLTGAPARPWNDAFARPAPLPASVASRSVSELYDACVARDPSRRPSARDMSVALSNADSTLVVPSFPAPLPGFESSEAPTAGFAPDTPDLPPTAEYPALVTELCESSGPSGSSVWGAPRRRSGALRAVALVGVTLAAVGALMVVVLGRPAPGASRNSAAVGEESLGAVAPDQVAPSTSKPPANSATSSESRTFYSIGGEVAASCTGDSARVRRWDAARGYWVKKVEKGPARELKVEFEQGKVRVRITIRCEDGRPAASIRT